MREIEPETALDGTVATIWVGLHVLMVACVVAEKVGNHTPSPAPGAFPKFVPVMVMVPPTAAFGVTAVTVALPVTTSREKF